MLRGELLGVAERDIGVAECWGSVVLSHDLNLVGVMLAVSHLFCFLARAFTFDYSFHQRTKRYFRVNFLLFCV